MSSISVVYNQDISTLNAPDGLVVDVLTPPTAALTPASVSACAFVGTATWGQFDAVQFPGDPTSAAATYGQQTVANTDLMTFVNLAYELGVTDVRTVRVGDGTELAAVLPILGANGSTLGAFVGLFPGSAVNPATVTFTYSPLTPTAFQQTSGNSQPVYVTATVSCKGFATATYQNLDGNVAVTSGGVTTYNIDGPTLMAALAAAANNGQSNGTPKSALFIGTIGSGTGAPMMNTAFTVSSLGSDGSAFAAGSPNSLDAAMLGNNSLVPGTGMYALDGNLSGAALALCGCTDIATIWGPMLAFCKAQNGHAVCAFPNGTSSQTAVTLKNIYGIADYGITPFAGDFVEIIDSVNGAISRFVDPSPLACARFAITAVQESPANLSMNGVIVGTSRVNTESNVPYSDPEVLLLENAGINFFSNDTAGGVGFAIRHNKNSLGKTAGYRGNIAYSRMIQFLVATYQSKLVGALVGQSQGFTSATDTVRSTLRALYNAFLGGLLDNSIIDGYTVVCDLTNNAPGRGLARVDTTVDQREIVDNIAVGLVSGVGIVVQVTAATPSASSASTT